MGLFMRTHHVRSFHVQLIDRCRSLSVVIKQGEEASPSVCVRVPVTEGEEHMEARNTHTHTLSQRTPTLAPVSPEEKYQQRIRTRDSEPETVNQRQKERERELFSY